MLHNPSRRATDHTKMLAPELRAMVLDLVGQQDVMRMSQTDRSWRAIASLRPEYSHTVLINLPAKAKLDTARYAATFVMLEEVVQQTASIDLLIRLAQPKDAKTERLRAAAHDSTWLKLCALIERTLNFVHRLTVMVHSPTLMDRLLNTALCSGPAPRLESLEVSSRPVSKLPVPNIPPNLFQGRAPRLREMTLPAHGTVLLPTALPIPEVQSFQALHALHIIEGKSFDILVDTFMPNLRLVTIQARWWLAATICLPPTLEELHIHIDGVHQSEYFNEDSLVALQSILKPPIPVRVLEIPYECHPMFHPDMLDLKIYLGAPRSWDPNDQVAAQRVIMVLTSHHVSARVTQVRIALTFSFGTADELHTRIFCAVTRNERAQAQVLTPFENLIGQLVEVQLDEDLFTRFIRMSDDDLFPVLERLTIDITKTDGCARIYDESDSDDYSVFDLPPPSGKTSNTISRVPSLVELNIVYQPGDVLQKKPKLIAEKRLQNFAHELRLDRQKIKPGLRCVWVRPAEEVELLSLDRFFSSVSLI